MTKTDSKEHILRKTFFLLLTKGCDGVSITDIQTQTGMSRGLLYHYYGSKEELFRVAVETFLNDIFLIDPEITKKYGIKEMIDYTVKQYRTAYKSWSTVPGALKITIANYDFLMYRMIEKQKSIARMYADMRHKENEAWRQAAAISLQKGEVRNVLSDAEIALHLIAMLDGLWTQAVGTKNPQEHLRQMKQVLTDYYKLLKP